MQKKQVLLKLDEVTKAEVDKARGMIPFQSFVEAIIKKELGIK